MHSAITQETVLYVDPENTNKNYPDLRFQKITNVSIKLKKHYL